jgi:hypothetical protein
MLRPVTTRRSGRSTGPLGGGEGIRRTYSTTLNHLGPVPPAHAAADAVLIVVHPCEIVLPVPEVFAPVGRRWFAAHGVKDRELSSRHVQLSMRDGRPWLADAGSRNGTWVDGRRLAAGEPVPLRDGTVVRVGGVLFVYRERLYGPREAAAPLGEMVGPFGLRSVAAELAALERLAPRNVLIEGETGTGKELLARAVAARLGRSRPFAAVNMAALPASLFESQLFGHVAGAFSDARQPAKGIVAAHDGGTVFLDELGELPVDLQPKLLRLLETRELLPVGAERPTAVDVLFVAATNRELAALVERGAFRRDLFARLALARLSLPPLRDRREDVPAIARALAPGLGVTLADPEIEAVERLMLDDWPENVRGLMAALSRVAALDPEPGLRLWAIDKALGGTRSAGAQAASGPDVGEAEVRAALHANGGNESEAARTLGISRGKLRRLLQKV